LATRLNAHELRQLKQRVGLRCELRALTLAETSAYILGRIQVAGGQGAQVFTREAVEAIYEASRGLPRTISVIADNALLGGFAVGLKPVTTRVIHDICRDFDLADPHARAGAPGRPSSSATPAAREPSDAPASADRKLTVVAKAPDAKALDPKPRPPAASDVGHGQTASTTPSKMFAGYTRRKRFLPFSGGRGDE
ncbi:MAG TPA: hypothetical protein VIX35_04820, partial [Vicinamibacterales bacterium]